MIPRRLAEKKSLCCLKVQMPDISMFSLATPSRCMSSALACHRSMCHLPLRLKAILSISKPASQNASYTSSPTSKESGPMLGPMITFRSSARDPYLCCIASMVLLPILATVPRHPACAAAIARTCASYISIGTQSAVDTPMQVRGSFVISASMPSAFRNVLRVVVSIIRNVETVVGQVRGKTSTLCRKGCYIIYGIILNHAAKLLKIFFFSKKMLYFRYLRLKIAHYG